MRIGGKMNITEGVGVYFASSSLSSGLIGYRVVMEPSTVRVQDAFEKDVTSSLPYMEVESEEVFEVTGVMMDGERILLPKKGEGGQLEEIDVLIMG
jgi:hypothetical protein